MEIKALGPDLSVGPQIEPGDVAELKRRGFRAIIGNRPDGEAPDQPAWDTLRAAAESAGIETRFIPVVGGALGESDARAFAAAMQELPKPVFAYCRTGARSTMLWDMTRALGQG